MIKSRILPILIVLGVLGIVDAGYLAYEHFSNTLPPCTTNIFSDCGKVLRSKYSEIFNIPLAIFGLVYYLTVTSSLFLIIKLKVKKTRLFLLILTGFGFLFSIYLIYLQIIVIKSICLYCMGSALISTLLFVISQVGFPKERKELAVFITKYSYRYILRPILFKIDSEKVHHTAIRIGSGFAKFKLTRELLASYYDVQSTKLKKTVLGIFFRNPIGLAAGFDYNADLTQILPSIGFGFLTIGTVTNLPYEGNPKPRLGRLPKSKSLYVNKGFKSEGADKIIEKLKNLKFQIPVGISIGRSNSPTLKNQNDSILDIITAFKKFEKAQIKNSYYEINISCPNLLYSKNISFYPPKNLNELLTAIDKLKLKKPLFVKMPIVKSDKETLAMLDVIAKHTPAGVIFGNLQVRSNPRLFDKNEIVKFKGEPGNFSGRPAFNRSNELIALTKKHFKDRFLIIGCGGIFSADDVKEKLKSGATFVQLITGLIFEGPQLISEINQKLEKSAK